MDDICRLCWGSGARVTFRKGHRQYWICQACDGDGVAEVLGKPAIKIGPAQTRFLKPETSHDR